MILTNFFPFLFYIIIFTLIIYIIFPVSDQLSYARDREGWEDDYEELVFMEGPLRTWEENGVKKATVRMGASSLNAHYFDWALKNNWTFPSNTIQHLMTIGGVATPMCHGAGIGHRTITDRIIKIGT